MRVRRLPTSSNEGRPASCPSSMRGGRLHTYSWIFLGLKEPFAPRKLCVTARFPGFSETSIHAAFGASVYKARQGMRPLRAGKICRGSTAAPYSANTRGAWELVDGDSGQRLC